MRLEAIGWGAVRDKKCKRGGFVCCAGGDHVAGRLRSLSVWNCVCLLRGSDGQSNGAGGIKRRQFADVRLGLELCLAGGDRGCRFQRNGGGAEEISLSVF